METKFKKGDKVQYNGQVVEITVVKKNFSTGEITYRLQGNGKVLGILVKENEIQSTQWEEPVIPQKQEEGHISISIEPIPMEETEAFLTLQKLDKNQLRRLIKNKQLDVDPNDYSSLQELCIAVYQELEKLQPND